MNILQCPGCNAKIKTNRVVHDGEQVNCPRCKEPFTVAGEPEPQEIYEEPSRSRDYKIPAIVAGVFVLGLSMGGAVLAIMLTKRAAEPLPTTVAKTPEEPSETKPEPVKDDKDQEKKQREFMGLMADGMAAMKLKDFASAVTSFEKALKLFPEDQDCVTRLADARANQAAVAKVQDDDEKRKAEYDRLMKQGQDALTDKKYPQAVRSFEEAMLLLPGDKDAYRALQNAKDALAANETELKKLDTYNTHMKSAKTADDAGRYTDAIREYSAALAVLPGDAAAIKGRRDAEKRLEDINDEDRKKAAFNSFMTDGNTAMQKRRFDAAIDAFQNALKLFNDPSAQRGLQTAKQALADAKRDYDLQMKNGDAALRMGRFEEAKRHFKDALAIMPDDEKAKKAFQDVDARLKEWKMAKEAYDRLMFDGQTAMRSKDYARAVQSFQEVLRLVPNDNEAKQQLNRARKELEDQLKDKKEYDKSMKEAQNLRQQRRYADALKAVKSAAKIAPNDRAAKQLQDAIEFELHMADGTAAMSQRKFAEAAREFEEAVKLRPNDPTAKALLAQAKASKK